MRYQRLVRPPTEAHSLVIPVTFGCSHAKCVFCAVNYGTPFRVRSLEEVKADIDEAAASGTAFERVFLADGDALVIRHDRLVEVLSYIRERLPSVQRVGVYGNAKDILRRSQNQFRELQALGLGIIYQGLESGDDRVLDFIQKDCTALEQLGAGRRVIEAGIILSVTVILGMGGRAGWREHALKTARLLNLLDPHSIRVHTIMVSPFAPLYQLVLEGKFEVPGPLETLEEERLLLSEIQLWDRPLLANFRTNYLPLVGLVSNEKEALIAQIDAVLEGGDYSRLRPEAARSL